ncbi:MAG: hypothetical protein NDJ90_00790 [Oligoflexia bacterium]|nr:hypothetical protein [Oligoflexia bacterium]
MRTATAYVLALFAIAGLAGPGVPGAFAIESVPAGAPVVAPPAGERVAAPPAATKKKLKGKNAREKEAEGTEALDRFEANTVIKSHYQLNGEPLEVDPD